MNWCVTSPALFGFAQEVKVNRTAAKMIGGLEKMSCKEKLNELWMNSLHTKKKNIDAAHLDI